MGKGWGGFSFIIMAKFNKQQVLAKITETGMVPVFYNNDMYYNCNLTLYFTIKNTDAFASVIVLFCSEISLQTCK